MNTAVNTCINIKAKDLIAKSIVSCNTVKVPPELLIKKVPKTIEDKLRYEIDKTSALFLRILRGAELGLTAYLKPEAGIPLLDLAPSILLKIRSILDISEELKKEYNKAFGKVKYDNKTGHISFYSLNDINCTNEIGGIDIPKQNVAIDSYKINYTINALKDKIPTITLNKETLIILTNG